MGPRDGDGHAGRASDRLSGLTGLSGMTGLVPAEVEPQLDLVEARRRRLLLVGAVAVLGVAVIAALLLVVDDVDLPWWVGAALLATAALYVLDATLQERTFSAVTRTLLAQEKRGAELEATVGDLGALLATARRINAVLLPEEVYDVVLAAAVDLLGAESGSIRLRVGEVLAVAASAGQDAPPVGATVAVEDDPAVLVVTLGVDVVEEDPPRLALPITVGQRHVGVLEVRRRSHDEPFTPRLALLGRLFAEEAAGAVVNANRYDLERSRAEELVSERQVRADAVADTVHDLRVPLSGLLGHAELLRDRHDRLDPARRQEAVERVVEAGQRLRHLIDEVFDAAASQARASRQRAPVRLLPLIRSAVASGTSAGVVDDARVEVEATGDPVALGDADALQRVLDNLVVNALEHGSPTVRIRVVEHRREVRVHVADRGPGIPADQLGALFQRATRDDGSPRGRGLPSVDGLVRAMGGRVGVRSREGVGSVFTVTLPAPDATEDVDG